ncbi:hypothetical protein OG573_32395 [Streptomyces sp. NBC_01205]|nr:hypothetical protein OG573_32395 [Streptomyces sp. NBC_01205]
MFAEDEAVPVPVIAALWQATAGLNLMQSRARIRELHDLSPLSSLDSTSGGSITLHDIVRDYLRLDFLGLARLAVLHATAIDATAASLAPSAPPAASCSGPVVAWWDLPDGYLTDHLITHMIGAGRTAEAEELAGDPRWIESRVPGAQVDGLEEGGGVGVGGVQMQVGADDQGAAIGSSAAAASHTRRPLRRGGRARRVPASRSTDARGRWRPSSPRR